MAITSAKTRTPSTASNTTIGNTGKYVGKQSEKCYNEDFLCN